MHKRDENFKGEAMKLYIAFFPVALYIFETKRRVISTTKTTTRSVNRKFREDVSTRRRYIYIYTRAIATKHRSNRHAPLKQYS